MDESILNWRKRDLLGRKAFIDKWARLRKSRDGYYRTVVILAKKNDKYLVDSDLEGIDIADEADIYAWDRRFVDKRWKNW